MLLSKCATIHQVLNKLECGFGTGAAYLKEGRGAYRYLGSGKFGTNYLTPSDLSLVYTAKDFGNEPLWCVSSVNYAPIWDESCADYDS